MEEDFRGKMYWNAGRRSLHHDEKPTQRPSFGNNNRTGHFHARQKSPSTMSRGRIRSSAAIKAAAAASSSQSSFFSSSSSAINKGYRVERHEQQRRTSRNFDVREDLWNTQKRAILSNRSKVFFFFFFLFWKNSVY